MAALKIWNGRGWGHVKPDGVEHWYGCAKSGADMLRLIRQYRGNEMFSRSELKDYASPGCWGKSMEGVVPVRGLWVKRYNNQNVERVL